MLKKQEVFTKILNVNIRYHENARLPVIQLNQIQTQTRFVFDPWV